MISIYKMLKFSFVLFLTKGIFGENFISDYNKEKKKEIDYLNRNFKENNSEMNQYRKLKDLSSLPNGNLIKEKINFLFKEGVSVVSKYFNQTLNNSEEYKNCANILSNDTETFNLFKEHFSSGRLLIDFGDENACNKKNYTYFLFHVDYSQYMENIDRSELGLEIINDNNVTELVKFMQKNHTCAGFCFFKQCNKTLFDILDDNINSRFKNSFKIETGLNITLNVTGLHKFLDGSYPKSEFYIFIGIVGFYIWLRLIFIFLSFYDKRVRKELIVPEFSESLISESKTKTNNNRLRLTEFIKYFSFKYQFDIMINDQYYYYNDTKLIFFNLIKLILMNMINFYNSFLSFLSTPKINSDTYYLLKGYTFNVIKFSYYCSSSFYFINGVIFSFKILGLIFKNKNTSFKTFLYFYLHVFIRILSIVIIFILIYEFQNDIIYIFSSRPIFSKTAFIELYDTEESKQLKENGLFSYLFVPFAYIYMNLINNHRNSIQPYLQMIMIIFNDFYFFSISVFIFYILSRLKNKIVDFLYFILIVLFLPINFYLRNCTENNLSRLDDGKLGYNFYQIIYSLNSIGKFDHCYTLYFLGNIIGILFFFHVMDQKSNNIFTNDLDNYFPFIFITKLSSLVNNLFSNEKKIRLMKFTFIFTILLSLLLTFNYNSIIGSSSKLHLDVNIMTRFFISYEMFFFNLFFSVFIFSCMFIFKLTDVNGKKLIHFTSRTYLVFILLSHLLNHYINLFFQIDMDMYFSNILFFSFATFIIIYFISLIITILFEIPIRIFFKRKIRKLFNIKEEMSV